MTPLLVVIPYCQKDAALAKILLEWIAEIGTPRSAAVLLAADNTVPRETIDEISAAAKKTFNFVKTMLITVSSGGWPPNKMFLSAGFQIANQYKWPFLWLEPDAIPLRKEWLEELENAYNECPKKFMGSIVKNEKQPELPSEYLNGVAIYPRDCVHTFSEIESINKGEKPWDIGSAAVVLPKAVNTPLIFHFWGTPELAPTFVVAKESGKQYPINCMDLSNIPKDAVIMHRNKDGSLINCLREIGKPLFIAPATPPPESVVKMIEAASAATAVITEPVTVSVPTPPFKQPEKTKPSAPATANK